MTATPQQDPNLDLGFGSLISRETRTRLLNRDGTFNVKREGLSAWARLNFYHYSLTMSWPRFLVLVGAGFFFSVHTLATIGYGNIVPISFAANLLVTIESLVGLLGFSVIAGIVFARFARPVAEIVFSRCALIGPYRDRTAFMFRIVNMKTNEIVELEAKVTRR